MPISVSDIDNVSFAITKKGYDVDEVDVFLEKVANGVGELINTIENLRAQLDNAEQSDFVVDEVEEEVFDDSSEDFDDLGDDAKKIIAEKESLINKLQDQLQAKQADDAAISQALIVAQRSADEIVAKANTKADITIQDAHDEADRIVNRAESEKQNILAAISKLEENRETCRNNYADMLRDFIEDANLKLNNLGFDDDVSAIPYEDIQPAVSEPIAFEDIQTPVDLGQTTAVEPIGVVEKDMSGFGVLSDEDDDID
ncbi:MAG: DivIVA domain-containing protein [Phoenicibacter congonensis]|uniref:Cell wall synthesis protein Wag31 n=1 Tax=Phoenicibacter congonensis TaxID=1944646 RepID=A0AA43RKX4_9ACTN|nr:DivIVA domain-containing protein [Phoenicibacter congonensis]